MTPDTQQEIELACQRLASRFVTYLDHGRFDELSELFTEDAMLTRVTGGVLKGRTRIVQGLSDRPDDLVTIHHASPVLVEAQGLQRANGTSSFVVFAKNGTSASAHPRLAATWHDVYRLDDGLWKIAERVARLLASE